MQNLVYKNEDERRVLYEWIQDTVFRSAKVVISKSLQAVGNHYHREKDEAFFLLSGKARKVIIGDTVEYDVEAPFLWECPKGVYHLFELEKDSILLGVATKKFDINDEITK